MLDPQHCLPGMINTFSPDNMYTMCSYYYVIRRIILLCSKRVLIHVGDFLLLDLSNIFNNRSVELALVFSFFFRGNCIVAYDTCYAR